MNITKSILSFLILIAFVFSTNAQNAENPWAISVGADLINIQGENVDSGLSFGAPALSLSRYIGAGLSVGVQYGLNNVKNNDEDLKYTSIDGIVKYNLTDGKIIPYLFAGYGITKFSPDGVEKEGMFPSADSGRTTLGGVGVNIPIGEKLNINVSTSYRGTSETNDSFNHLQHIVGLSYNFGAGDKDKDGVSDKKDECPDIPGLKEFNGCPDTDGDGIPDNKDRCPEEAGSEELQGCPDSDGDGIADNDDACPNKSGTKEMNGCPDSDGDGVADNVDKCIDIAGEIDNEGCPWEDRDNDGVPDKDDNCPDEEGSIANNGCPDEPTDLLNFISSNKSIVLFSASSSKLDSNDKTALDELKILLETYPKASLKIAGHASSDGSSRYNQTLSDKRAASVKEYLVSKGINGDRLDAIGYGEDKPIGDNNTVKGRANSRRVNINRNAKMTVNK